ncbi:exopolysaccharide biosynthesis protein [Rhizobium sp. SSA_523]|uniref:exopolysaccharide biosynthesis protein n=1 Tax=Rhizobium sp. SSA_523 TaxID=2952477 RepID=UPI002090B966|nr:exopolysaccharide biosynthesis protein [Rhizobium sp. SSA_523]MCO5730934.1 exopolysaccharide biosynthesis protein [Rhizobium sp. SSA_523]WKC24254.1 exopolysaccharide biosynthesis protein [Rhizobium sp. SSA_523]
MASMDQPMQQDGTARQQANGGEDNLTGVITTIGSLGQSKDQVTIHDVREAIGERSFGPFLLVPALIELSPIGGIPGLPTVIALIISLFAVQILFGRKHLWLPQFLEQRQVEGKKLTAAMDKMKPAAGFVDRLLAPRLKWLTKAPWLQVAALIAVLLCFTVPPLELIPFASSAPMGAIALFGLSLTARDGLMAVLAGLVSLSAVYLVYTVITGAA